MPNEHTLIRPLALLVLLMPLTGCVIERIDRILAERGVTWDEQTDSDTSTGSSSSTSGSSTGDTSTGDTSTTALQTGDATATATSAEASAPGGTTEATSDATSEPLPVCGDGVVDPGESCDDMNDDPDDGCSACARDSIVFVTSQVYQGAINGLKGADQRCRMLAAIADLPRFETYRAWLSDSTLAARDRLLHSPGRYVLVNGLVVAQNWDALVSGQLARPIDVDEMSQTQHYIAWTGTLPDGTPAFGSEFCDDWTSHEGDKYGGVGITNMADAWWSFFEHGDCSSDLHLYCIEQ